MVLVSPVDPQPQPSAGRHFFPAPRSASSAALQLSIKGDSLREGSQEDTLVSTHACDGNPCELASFPRTKSKPSSPAYGTPPTPRDRLGKRGFQIQRRLVDKCRIKLSVPPKWALDPTSAEAFHGPASDARETQLLVRCAQSARARFDTVPVDPMHDGREPQSIVSFNV